MTTLDLALHSPEEFAVPIIHAQPAELAGRGPLIHVRLSLPDEFALQLQEAGRIVPAPIGGLALLDPGAKSIGVDDAIAQHLQLPVIEQARASAATDVSVQRHVYPISIEVGGCSLTITTHAIGGAYLSRGYIAVIGAIAVQEQLWEA